MRELKSIKEKILRSGIYAVHCEIIARSSLDLKNSISNFGKHMGFYGMEKSKKYNIAENLKEINKGFAKNILKKILMEGMAYPTKKMTAKQAAELINEFFSLFTKNAKFFSNYYFDKSLSPQAYNPITAATFDTGILIIDENNIGCLWIEDED